MSEKHPGGRPSEYDPRFIDEMALYVEQLPNGEKVPTIEGFAYRIGVSKKAIYTWAEENPEFLQATERLKDRQAILLQNKGLGGEFAPTITKLMLSPNHGFAEKMDTTIISGGFLLSKAIESVDGATISHPFGSRSVGVDHRTNLESAASPLQD
jgi:hypothetical protein